MIPSRIPLIDVLHNIVSALAWEFSLMRVDLICIKAMLLSFPLFNFSWFSLLIWCIHLLGHYSRCYRMMICFVVCSTSGRMFLIYLKWNCFLHVSAPTIFHSLTPISCGILLGLGLLRFHACKSISLRPTLCLHPLKLILIIVPEAESSLCPCDYSEDDSTFSCSCVCIIIYLPFIFTPSIILSLSQNVQCHVLTYICSAFLQSTYKSMFSGTQLYLLKAKGWETTELLLFSIKATCS